MRGPIQPRRAIRRAVQSTARLRMDMLSLAEVAARHRVTLLLQHGSTMSGRVHAHSDLDIAALFELPPVPASGTGSPASTTRSTLASCSRRFARRCVTSRSTCATWMRGSVDSHASGCSPGILRAGRCALSYFCRAGVSGAVKRRSTQSRPNPCGARKLCSRPDAACPISWWPEHGAIILARAPEMNVKLNTPTQAG